MATLNQHYNTKQTGTTVRKTFLVPLNEIYVEEGFNVRDIDAEHVQEFCQAYIDGEFVPPLVVEVTTRGVKIIDGHHRYYGAMAAAERGIELRLECKDFTGNEADKVAFMVTSSQGRALTPVERGQAYNRLRNHGMTNEEIARKVKRSVSDVTIHIQLIECEGPIVEMVKAGEMGHTTAVNLQKEHGVNAANIAVEMKEKAKAEGKTKVSIQPQFSAKKARQLVEIMTRAERDDNSFVMNKVDADEASKIIAEYLS